MAIRILIILLPYLVGFAWRESPGASIAWSLAGSIFVAGIAQTNWFRQSGENVPFTRRLLRPTSMYHLIFVAYNVVGAGAYALDTAGYAIWGVEPIAPTGNLVLIAECQRLLLLAQASVTVGMKLAGFRYSRPKYEIPSLPPYSLIVISFASLGIATLASIIPSLNQLSAKLLVISTTAVSVEIAICIQRKRFNNLLLTLVLLGLNLFEQSVSGWKGNILWSTIVLGAMLFPIMPKRVVIGGGVFVLFWALYFYPFGLALRPLLWEGGVSRNRAVELSMNEALNMSFDERLDGVWTMMVGRANDQYQFGKYVEYVPASHPYYNLEILSNSMTALIPRVLWPDKPDMEIVSMQRVYDAGVVSSESYVSAKSNFYQDAYLSSGEWGIVLAGLLFGALAILFSRLCEEMFGSYTIGTCLVYTSLFAPIVTQPPNFEYLFGAVAMSAFLMFALFALGRATGWVVPTISEAKKGPTTSTSVGASSTTTRRQQLKKSPEEILVSRGNTFGSAV
jgi:hypothetical protein